MNVIGFVKAQASTYSLLLSVVVVMLWPQVTAAIVLLDVCAGTELANEADGSRRTESMDNNTASPVEGLSVTRNVYMRLLSMLGSANAGTRQGPCLRITSEDGTTLAHLIKGEYVAIDVEFLQSLVSITKEDGALDALMSHAFHRHGQEFGSDDDTAIRILQEQPSTEDAIAYLLAHEISHFLLLHHKRFPCFIHGDDSAWLDCQEELLKNEYDADDSAFQLVIDAGYSMDPTSLFVLYFASRNLLEIPHKEDGQSTAVTAVIKNELRTGQMTRSGLSVEAPYKVSRICAYQLDVGVRILRLLYTGETDEEGALGVRTMRNDKYDTKDGRQFRREFTGLIYRDYAQCTQGLMVMFLALEQLSKTAEPELPDTPENDLETFTSQVFSHLRTRMYAACNMYVRYAYYGQWREPGISGLQCSPPSPEALEAFTR